MPYILLTRPLDDAIELEKDLNLPVLKAPLLHAELIFQEKKPAAIDYNNLIVTSARALRFFSEINAFLKKPIWCVGATTARTAKDLGFETIYTAENSAAGLCELILSKASSKSETFLHICGECLHFDIVEKLRENGYRADKIILYKTTPVKWFDEDVLKAFLNHRIAMIPVFSKKTAETLAKVIRYHKLEPYLEKITLVVCTQNIAIPLQEFKWQNVIITHDLSAPALAMLYRKAMRKRKLDMPVKKLWAWLAGTAVIITLLSWVSFYLWGTHFLNTHTLIDAQKFKKDILISLKSERGQDSTNNTHMFNELTTEVRGLQEKIKTLKTEFATFPHSTEVPFYFRAYILVSYIEDQIKVAVVDPGIWQELVKLLLENKATLPETVLDFKEIPPAKEELLQQLQKLKQSVLPDAEVQNHSKKLTHRWLEKITKYTGPIVISRIEDSSPTVPTITDQAFQAVNNDDEAQLKALNAAKETPENIRDILAKAQARLQILQRLKELKPLLLTLSQKNKE